MAFFVTSFLTDIMGPVLPLAHTSLNLSLTLTGFLPFSFFIAYGIMSIPAGYLVERLGWKSVMVLSYMVSVCGCFIFVLFPGFMTFTVSLFTIGAGMAMLQTVVNPLLRIVGGEEHYSFYSVLAQIFFGIASFISPFVFSYLVLNLPYNKGHNMFLYLMSKLVPYGMTWVSIYWICSIISLVIMAFIIFLKFPERPHNSNSFEGFAVVPKLMKNKIVLLYFFAIFAYIGTEQGICNWMSKFLNSYHGYDVRTTGAQCIAMFWGIMTFSGITGLILLKIFDVRKILSVFIVLAIITDTLALFGTAKISLIAFSACGFSLSLMYPCTYSLALNSVREHHGAFAGILCSAIFGGAIIPLLIGAMGDIFGLRAGMSVTYLTLLFLLYVAMTARPIVHNKTINLKELFGVKLHE